MKNKIKFVPTILGKKNTDDAPIESIKTIPAWYKDLAQYARGTSNNIKNLHPINDRGSDGTDVSTKLCSPFLDALTSGYMNVLPEDITVKIKSDGKPELSWESDNALVDLRVSPDMAIPPEYYPIHFGWKMTWYYETPPGYSLLITQPMNRFDLPFIGASGIVDSDIWGLPVFIPFFLRKDFEGVIKKGTPIFQMIPIKRDDWELDLDFSDEAYWKHATLEEKRRSHLTAHYKKTTWQKKIF
jgi:hypothetical protein